MLTAVSHKTFLLFFICNFLPQIVSIVNINRGHNTNPAHMLLSKNHNFSTYAVVHYRFNSERSPPHHYLPNSTTTMQPKLCVVWSLPHFYKWSLHLVKHVAIIRLFTNYSTPQIAAHLKDSMQHGIAHEWLALVP